MRALFVSSHINPFETPLSGDAQRTQLLLKACSAICDVDVVAFTGNVESNLPNVSVVYSNYVPSVRRGNKKVSKWFDLIKLWNINALFPQSADKLNVIDRLMSSGKYDFIVTRYLPRALECGLWKYKEKLILDFDDSLSAFFYNDIKETDRWTTRLRKRIMAKEASYISKKAVGKLYYSFFSNLEDARKNGAFHLPNIPFYDVNCDVVDFKQQPPRIVFVGILGYEPNQKGVEHFLDCVYKPLHEKMNDVEFVIVGKPKDEKQKKNWESYPNVRLTGFIDDLRNEYNQARVVVVPIYQGGGTNIKLLEAMRMNRACVVSEFSTRGINMTFQDKTDYLVSRSDEEFIENTMLLLTNESENKRISANAFAKMQEYYSFDAFKNIVSQAFVK